MKIITKDINHEPLIVQVREIFEIPTISPLKLVFYDYKFSLVYKLNQFWFFLPLAEFNTKKFENKEKIPILTKVDGKPKIVEGLQMLEIGRQFSGDYVSYRIVLHENKIKLIETSLEGFWVFDESKVFDLNFLEC